MQRIYLLECDILVSFDNLRITDAQLCRPLIIGHRNFKHIQSLHINSNAQKTNPIGLQEVDLHANT